MQLNNRIFPVLLGIILLFSCQEEKKFALLSTDIDLEDVEYVILSNHLNGQKDTLQTKENQVEIAIDEPQILRLQYGRGSERLFVKPGAVIELISEDNKIKVRGTLSGENDLTNKIENELIRIRQEYSPLELGKLKQEEYLKKLQEKYRVSDSLLAASSEIDSWVTSLLTKRVKSMKAQDKIMYPRYYAYVTKDTTPTPETYYDFITELDLNDPDLLYFTDGADVISQVIRRDVKYTSAKEYYKTVFDRTDSLITNQKVKEYLLQKFLTEKLNLGGIDGVEELLHSYLATTENEFYKKKVQDLVSIWEDLKQGKVAPGFDGVTPEGKTVSLADLKGQNVYIDVWATWCGPCVAEIPSLKKIEKDYHDENIAFVSVSIDQQKDQEKWKEFILDRELGGIQLMEENAWQSEIVESYNIKGIPRFILIDKEGKIVTVDAPRPSSDKLKVMLDKLES